MAEILVGTSGYHYHEWVGKVYPEGTKPEDYLRCYSGMFHTVELNYSFYGMPEAGQIAGMLEKGGKNMTFAVKAHKTLTHEVKADAWEGEAEKFLSAIKPLCNAGKLEAVLFQFPYSYGYTKENRVYLDRLMRRFADVPKAVEFRKSDWYCGKVLEGMKARGIPLVSLDMPDLPKLPPQMDAVTAPVSYIRLHGRNGKAWWGSEAHARYDYLYTDAEIEALAARIERVAEQARRVLVYFNNHPCGKAVENARTLERLMGKMGLTKAED